MGATAWVRRMEQKFNRQWRHHYRDLPAFPGKGVPDGTRIVIIGGGIAGSAFARQMALLSDKEQRNVEITVINSTNCNYCGGLITNVAMASLQNIYDLDVPDDLVLKEVDECIYVNQYGSVTVSLPEPLTATLRTSRFGLPGFDDSIKERITAGLPDTARAKVHILEPTLAKRVEKGEGDGANWRVVLSKRNPDNTNQVLECDIVVMACGFKSLGRPMLKEFQELTGYTPPPTIPASVTEIDTGKAVLNRIENRIFMLDGIIPDCMLAFIPKGPQWLTLTALNKRLGKEDIDRIFAHPRVKEFIDLPQASQNLRCHTICGASVYMDAAKKYFGDNWLVIGDLTGYGRILKDGYFSAFLGARLAAETLIYRGAGAAALRYGYHNRLAHFSRDNFFGRQLFKVNNRLQLAKWFARYFINAAQEENKEQNGSFVHAAIRALATGELSYAVITLLFLMGLFRYPFAALAGGRNNGGS